LATKVRVELIRKRKILLPNVRLSSFIKGFLTFILTKPLSVCGCQKSEKALRISRLYKLRWLS